MPERIYAIEGRKIQTYEEGDDSTQPKELKEYVILPKATILLNEQKTTLASLKIGDEVVIGNGTVDGFNRIEACRDMLEFHKAGKAEDLSHPKILKLVEEETPEHTEYHSDPPKSTTSEQVTPPHSSSETTKASSLPGKKK